MDRHRDACPDQVDGFTQEAQWLIRELMKELEDQFKLDVQVGKSADLSVVSVKGEEWRSRRRRRSQARCSHTQPPMASLLQPVGTGK